MSGDKQKGLTCNASLFVRNYLINRRKIALAAKLLSKTALDKHEGTGSQSF